MSENITCPLCKSQHHKLAFDINHYQLRSCEVCNLHFVHPYIQKEENRNPLAVKSQFDGEKRAVSGYFKCISKYYKNINSYLDIGCGCGGLLGKAKEFDIKIRRGVEDDLQRAAFAREYAACQILEVKDLFIGEEKYDLITLINVFSHISNLDTFLARVHHILNPHGRIIIKTGLFKSGFRRNNLFDWQIPEHIHFIGENTMKFIAQKYNFRVLESINIPLAEEMMSENYLLSAGLSSCRNLIKKIFYYTPGVSCLLRKIYTVYTRNRLFSNIVVLEKI